MLISSLQNSSTLLSELAAASTSSSSTSSSNSFDSALSTLMSAIKSGDSSAAKTDLAAVKNWFPPTPTPAARWASFSPAFPPRSRTTISPVRKVR